MSPYHANAELGPPSGPYQLVRIRLLGLVASRMLPGFSDSEVVDPKVYEMSTVPCQQTTGQSVDEWLRQFRHLWMTERLCPDPRMYEVEESSWRAELGLRRDFTHLLVMGHDAYVEVIAKSWDWISEGRI